MEDFRDIQKELVDKMIEEKNNKINDMMIQALAIKGYSFIKRHELELFIKENCRSVVHPKHTIYYVKDVPFVKHIHATDIINTSFNKDREIKMYMDIGSYHII